MFLSVYTLKTLISVGIVVTLLLGILLLYILVYAFLISSVTAQILPDFRNGFIGTFMATSVMMILSSLSGIYGLIRKNNKFVIIYSVTMLFYFIIFIVLAAFLIKYPSSLESSCNQKDDTDPYRNSVLLANKTLGKTCQCYFNNIDAYTDSQQKELKKMGFTNHTNIMNDSLPINAENCPEWSNQTYGVTNQIIFLESVFNCSGWCKVESQYNLYYLFTDVNRGIPEKTCIESLLTFFDQFGYIMEICCFCMGFVLFLILLTILCLCCHPDRGQQYDAMKFFKSTLMVQLNEEDDNSKPNITISST